MRYVQGTRLDSKELHQEEIAILLWEKLILKYAINSNTGRVINALKRH